MRKIIDILKQVRPELDYSTSADFFEDGMLDSFDLVTLVSELDSVYGISIDGLDIVPENFSSIERIEALVQRYGITP